MVRLSSLGGGALAPIGAPKPRAETPMRGAGGIEFAGSTSVGGADEGGGAATVGVTVGDGNSGWLGGGGSGGEVSMRGAVGADGLGDRVDGGDEGLFARA